MPSITKREDSELRQALSRRKWAMPFEGKGIIYLRPTDPNDDHIEPLPEVLLPADRCFEGYLPDSGHGIRVAVN